MTETAMETGGLNFNIQPRNARNVTLLDDPPLGHIQLLVLRKLYDLEDDAYGVMVLQTLSLETGVLIDQSQIYQIIRKLDKTKGFIKVKEMRKQEGRRPPLKIYELTDKGRAALKQTGEHYQAVAKYAINGHQTEE